MNRKQTLTIAGALSVMLVTSIFQPRAEAAANVDNTISSFVPTRTQSSTEITLTWTMAGNAKPTSFQIVQMPQPGLPGQTVTWNVIGTARSAFSAGSLKPGWLYQFQITAYDQSGNPGPSRGCSLGTRSGLVLLPIPWWNTNWGTAGNPLYFRSAGLSPNAHGVVADLLNLGPNAVTVTVRSLGADPWYLDPFAQTGTYTVTVAPYSDVTCRVYFQPSLRWRPAVNQRVTFHTQLVFSCSPANILTDQLQPVDLYAYVIGAP